MTYREIPDIPGNTRHTQKYPRTEWQKLRERRSPKSLDSTANFKPEKHYFVLILIFVAIYAFYKIFIMF